MKTPEGKNFLDYFFVLRPALMPPVWTIFLLGAGFRATQLPEAVTPHLIAAFVAIFWLAGGIYLLNQYFDIESDRINQKLHFLPLGLVSKSAALFLYILLNVAALAVAMWISLELFLLSLIIVMMGIAYSAPPWHWKNKPYAALIANAAGHGSVVFLFGWLLTNGPLPEGLVNSLPYFLAVGAIYLLTTIPDTEGDEQAGKRTLAVALGRVRCARWALGWYWGAVLTAFYTTDLLFLLAALPVAYLFIKAAKGDPERAVAAVRWSVGLLSVMACIYFPWYAAVLIVGFLGTRWYYKRRFGLIYP